MDAKNSDVKDDCPITYIGTLASLLCLSHFENLSPSDAEEMVVILKCFSKGEITTNSFIHSKSQQNLSLLKNEEDRAIVGSVFLQQGVMLSEKHLMITSGQMPDVYLETIKQRAANEGNSHLSQVIGGCINGFDPIIDRLSTDGRSSASYLINFKPTYHSLSDFITKIESRLSSKT